MAWQTPVTNWNSTMGVAASDLNRIEGNTADLDTRIGQVARAYEQQIATTSQITLVSLTPSATKMFLAGLYLRVVTAATTVAATVTFNDAGGAQTYQLIPSQSLPVGSHSFLDYIFGATTSALVAINITVGTINQVYANAAIKEV